MHNHIIESIGSWGVKTTPAERRMGLVKGGDIVEVPPELQRYPISHKYSRIANISTDGIAHVCEGMGSAFLLESGSCDISGGPWWDIPVKLVKPKYELHLTTCWNWGDNSAGASQGVYYHIYRPIHTLTVHPDDVKSRYAVDENLARKGTFMHENYLDPSEWTLLFKGECLLGQYRWVFLRKQEG